MNSNHPDDMVCRHPDCDESATETYTGRAENELELCSDHYFEAVWPAVRTVSTTSETDGEVEMGGGPIYNALFGWLK